MAEASPKEQRKPIQMPARAPRLSRRRALQLIGLGGGLTAAAVADWPSRRAKADTPATITGLGPDDATSTEFQIVRVNHVGQIVEQIPRQARLFREDLGNDVGLDMVAIPAGEFVMGSAADETGHNPDEGPLRSVSIAPFWMGRFPVTQLQYLRVMNANPAYFDERGANYPVEQVSWNDAVAFCEKLSEQTGRTYRLPSEAEWEYACRAGTTTPFTFGPTITTALANYDGSYVYGAAPEGKFRRATTEVGIFPANDFGLYDVHGNVWEWCQDEWHDSYEDAPKDGSVWGEGGDPDRRVIRGGSWIDDSAVCRSANRNRFPRGQTLRLIGLRVVCTDR